MGQLINVLLANGAYATANIYLYRILSEKNPNSEIIATQIGLDTK